MKIALLCATQRGLLFLQTLNRLSPGAEFIVFSFPEDPWEPKFIHDIRECTLSFGGQFFEYRNADRDDFYSVWETCQVDIMFVVNWRYLIPERIWKSPRLGSYVFHDSLLPLYRGFSPTVWAIINGEKQTGVSLFKITDKMDEGDIVDQIVVPIRETDYIYDVMQHVTNAYLSIIEKNFYSLVSGVVQLKSQEHDNATYTCKRVPEDNVIEWDKSATEIYNLIRACSKPYSGAYTFLRGKRIVIWKAELLKSYRKYIGCVAGRVVEIIPDKGVIVLAGHGALLINEVQLDDGINTCASLCITSIKDTLGR